MKAATLNASLINEAIRTFPTGAGWTHLICRDLISDAGRGKRSWKCIWELDGKAGLYAFLLPRSLFQRRYTFQLDGPARRKLPFAFSARDLQAVHKKYFVAYVGRTSNLLSRLQLHFHATEKSTAAQVRKALVSCGYVESPELALDFILQNGLIVYRILEGDDNVANRDIVEVALWAKYKCPFNIKSER
jgi:hypothetical protein